MMQLITPNPNIPCKPGWCLQYVRQAFGAPAVEPTATAGWANAKFRHEDWDFPEGVAVPVWFKLATEPAGHVALRMADGSVYSTSDDSTVPHHHPDMQDLIRYYWRNPLTYLGWSEDISGVRVVQEVNLQTQSETITPLSEEDDMANLTEDNLDAIADRVARKIHTEPDGTTYSLLWFLKSDRAKLAEVAKSIVDNIFLTEFARQGEGQSGTTNLFSILSWSDSNFTHAGSGNASSVPVVDPEQVRATLEAGIHESLKDLTVTLSNAEAK